MEKTKEKKKKKFGWSHSHGGGFVAVSVCKVWTGTARSYPSDNYTDMARWIRSTQRKCLDSRGCKYKRTCKVWAKSWKTDQNKRAPVKDKAKSITSALLRGHDSWLMTLSDVLSCFPLNGYLFSF